LDETKLERKWQKRIEMEFLKLQEKLKKNLRNLKRLEEGEGGETELKSLGEGPDVVRNDEGVQKCSFLACCQKRKLEGRVAGRGPLPKLGKRFDEAKPGCSF
jgi:hypothetical protein